MEKSTTRFERTRSLCQPQNNSFLNEASNFLKSFFSSFNHSVIDKALKISNRACRNPVFLNPFNLNLIVWLFCLSNQLYISSWLRF